MVKAGVNLCPFLHALVEEYIGHLETEGKTVMKMSLFSLLNFLEESEPENQRDVLSKCWKDKKTCHFFRIPRFFLEKSITRHDRATSGVAPIK